ncbi:hypothetical protein EAH75_18235 [Rhodanobacter glycinis]|uniref:Uncharacterized protein n=1 Tax=Rhodanobacter glycinis TaxID=582702 RepID=A0A502F842_9GAMM|nr:hypothetical protein [Rhodanobacter glycinis]TPG05379.1 hypothetical protein EAH88_15555 [Rhodanobacter glycinis]TPG45548.1 hypothetical protein EAH75_18235 [Rhodanobacter glycinis]
MPMHSDGMEPSRILLSRALHAALAILLLTAVHHAYGAYAYDTPWRLHVVIVAGVTALLLWGAVHVLRRRPAGVAHTAAWAVFCLLDLLLPVAGIGLFEGGYNHALKNALYFGGASAPLLARLFPPPMYELPGDGFFETTGVLQLVLGVVAACRLYRLVRHGRHARARSRAGQA